MENAPDRAELEENTWQLWGLFNFGVWFQHKTKKRGLVQNAQVAKAINLIHLKK